MFAAIQGMEVRRGSARERALFDMLDVPLDDVVGVDARPIQESALEIRPNYDLFPHQRDAVTRVITALGVEPRRVLLHMPTGGGKTRVAMNVIADHLRESEPALVVWLAYSEELCEQALEEFGQAWSVLGNRRIGVYRFWGSLEPPLDQLRDGLLVAGLAKTYSVARTSVQRIASLADRVTMVVIDEAHMAVADTYALTLDVLTKRADTRLLGLTATPGRTWADIESR